jgi:Fe2+ transport system protein FeoA
MCFLKGDIMSARLRFNVQADGSRLLARKLLLGNEFVTINIVPLESGGHQFDVLSLTTGESLLSGVEMTVPKLQKKLKKKLEELGVVFDTEVRQKRVATTSQPEKTTVELVGEL